MDPLRLCIAMGPLAVYLLALGAVNLGRRPLVVRGHRDTAALAVALGGLVIVGPIELFTPDAAAAHFGWWVWCFLLALYALCAALLVLTQRPRLVVYNVSGEAFRPLFVDLCAWLDPQARWAGDNVELPGTGLEVRVEQFAPMRNVSLIGQGEYVNPSGWRQLEAALTERMTSVETRSNPAGALMVGVGLALLLSVGWNSVTRAPEITQAFFEMLRL